MLKLIENIKKVCKTSDKLIEQQNKTINSSNILQNILEIGGSEIDLDKITSIEILRPILNSFPKNADILIYFLPMEIKEIILIYKLYSWVNKLHFHSVSCIRLVSKYWCNKIDKLFKFYKETEFNNLIETPTYKHIYDFNNMFGLDKLSNKIYIDYHSFHYDILFKGENRKKPKFLICIYVYLFDFRQTNEIIKFGGMTQNLTLNNKEIIWYKYPNGFDNIEVFFFNDMEIEDLLRYGIYKHEFHTTIHSTYIKFNENKVNTLFYTTLNNKNDVLINLNERNNINIVHRYIKLSKIFRDKLNILNKQEAINYSIKWIESKYKYFITILNFLFNEKTTSILNLDIIDDEDISFIDYIYKRKNISVKIYRWYGNLTFTFKFKNGQKLFKCFCHYTRDTLNQTEKLYNFNFEKFDVFKYKTLEKYFDINHTTKLFNSFEKSLSY